MVVTGLIFPRGGGNPLGWFRLVFPISILLYVFPMHFECKIRQKFDNKDQKTLSSFNVLHQAVRVVCETREVLLTTGTGYLYLPE